MFFWQLKAQYYFDPVLGNVCVSLDCAGVLYSCKQVQGRRLNMRQKELLI